MIWVALLGLGLLIATVLIQYEGLRFLWVYAKTMSYRERLRPLLLVFGIILLHLFETTVFGFGYWWAEAMMHVGHLVGTDLSWHDYFYFSVETYTTLGFGNIYPVGDLRLIVSVEALCGLLMLGWSASFLYLAMERYWGGAHENN